MTYNIYKDNLNSLTHTAEQHPWAQAVYSPHCSKCIELFGNMLQAYYRYLETLKEPPHE